jgi:LysR family transcriptional activator of nhaA
MLNYKQLHHFWTVARAGGIVRAAERSGLAPQTLSGQIATLETDLGVNLFKRQGRGLVLTETGRMVLDYAEEIFRLGNELEEALQSRATGRAVPFRVGIADVVPKAIAWLLLAPSMDLPEPMRIVCREGKFDALLGELAIHKLDVVLADSPLPPAMDVRGFSHALGESTIGFYAAPALAARLAGDFPALVPRVGLEPPHLAAADFESAASTDSAIPAREAAHYLRTVQEPTASINRSGLEHDTMLTLADFDYPAPTS